MREQVFVKNRGKNARFGIREMKAYKPGGNSLIIKGAFAGVAHGDLGRAYGKIPSPPGRAFLPGYDIAGEVVEVGKREGNFRIGNRVVALCGTGGWARFCETDYSRAAKIPDGLDLRTAAALGLNYLTAYQMLFRRGNLKNGNWVLTYGAGGGLGSAVLDLCRCFQINAVGVVSKDKKELVESYGALFLENNLADGNAIALICPPGIDLVLDPFSDSRRKKSMELAKPGGGVIGYGFLEKKADPFLFMTAGIAMKLRFPNKNYQFYSVEAPDNVAFLKEDYRKIFDLALNKQISPLVSGFYRLEDYESAVAAQNNRSRSGKVLLDLS